MFGMRITHANARLTSFSLSTVRSAAAWPNMQTGRPNTYVRIACIYLHPYFARFSTAGNTPGIHVFLQLLQRHVPSSSCDFAHDFLPPTQATGKSATPATAVNTTTKAWNKQESESVFHKSRVLHTLLTKLK